MKKRQTMWVLIFGGSALPEVKKRAVKKQQRGCCSSQPVRTVSGGSARGGLKATKAEAVNMVVVS